MKISLKLTLTIGERDEPVTVDLTGTHHDIPQATYGGGFQPPEEDDRR